MVTCAKALNIFHRWSLLLLLSSASFISPSREPHTGPSKEYRAWTRSIKWLLITHYLCDLALHFPLLLNEGYFVNSFAYKIWKEKIFFRKEEIGTDDLSGFIQVCNPTFLLSTTICWFCWTLACSVDQWLDIALFISSESLGTRVSATCNNGTAYVWEFSGGLPRVWDVPC